MRFGRKVWVCWRCWEQLEHPEYKQIAGGKELLQAVLSWHLMAVGASHPESKFGSLF